MFCVYCQREVVNGKHHCEERVIPHLNFSVEDLYKTGSRKLDTYFNLFPTSSGHRNNPKPTDNY